MANSCLPTLSMNLFQLWLLSLKAELTDVSKIRIILEELEIPYQDELVKFSEVKSESYLKLNVNGRLPTIHDPNTGITLWEVC